MPAHVLSAARSNSYGLGPASAHRNLHLFSAVAPKRPEHLAGEALRVDAQQRGVLRQIAEGERGFDPAASVRVE